MELNDPTDPYEAIAELKSLVDRIYSGAFLEDSSVTDGRMRFIGGLLLIDAGGTLQVVGTFDGDGDFIWSGPWKFTGDGEITGATSITGDIDLEGTMTIPGTEPIVLRSVDGTAYIIAGGGRLRGTSDGINLQAPGGGSIFAAAGAIMGAGLTMEDNQIAVYADGVRLFGADTVPANEVDQWLGFKNGVMVKVDASTGGPTGSGEFAWPFDLSTVSKEYDPLDPGYDNGHLGIDFGIGSGTPIPASTGGTVLANGWDDERGWYVILDHGTRGAYALTTRYYHLNVQSPLAEGSAVTKGQTIGNVGSTGMSTGPHLHFETRRNGDAMNPRTFMSIYGE